MFTDEDVARASSSASFDLPSDTTSPARARSHVRRVLVRWSLPGLLEPLLLVVSELVSNAVRHGRPPVRLLLRRVGHDAVRVDVHDGGPEFTSGKRGDSAQADRASEGGRGLQLVEAMSADSGVDNSRDDGKRVWAVVEPQ